MPSLQDHLSLSPELRTFYILYILLYSTIGALLNAAVVVVSKQAMASGSEYAVFVGAGGLAAGITAGFRGLIKGSQWAWVDLGPLENPFCIIAEAYTYFAVLGPNLAIHPLLLQRYLRFLHPTLLERMFGTSGKRRMVAVAFFAFALVPVIATAVTIENLDRMDGGMICRNRSLVPGSRLILFSYVFAILLVHYALSLLYTASVGRKLMGHKSLPANSQPTAVQAETRRILLGCWLQTLLPFALFLPITAQAWLGDILSSESYPLVVVVLTDCFHLTPIGYAVVVFAILAPYRKAAAHVILHNSNRVISIHSGDLK